MPALRLVWEVVRGRLMGRDFVALEGRAARQV
jgi:hypothetical protein